MENRFSRTEMLIGTENFRKLRHARVAVFGVGGVGGYVVEALARSGVGTLDLIDRDIVSISNINRQIIALSSTVGQYKTEVAKARVKDINPDIHVNIYKIPSLKGESPDRGSVFFARPPEGTCIISGNVQ